jgi:hypothetical protein
MHFFFRYKTDRLEMNGDSYRLKQSRRRIAPSPLMGSLQCSQILSKTPDVGNFYILERMLIRRLILESSWGYSAFHVSPGMMRFINSSKSGTVKAVSP